ncbi:mucin-2-like [Sycon ciliatum]|uniref:mucin-2-like n=1 Tax=Sycon ciliatum TaxID=27933 RepID=UPI0031F603CD
MEKDDDSEYYAFPVEMLFKAQPGLGSPMAARREENMEGLARQQHSEMQAWQRDAESAAATAHLGEADKIQPLAALKSQHNAASECAESVKIPQSVLEALDVPPPALQLEQHGKVGEGGQRVPESEDVVGGVRVQLGPGECDDVFDKRHSRTTVSTVQLGLAAGSTVQPGLAAGSTVQPGLAAGSTVQPLLAAAATAAQADVNAGCAGESTVDKAQPAQLASGTATSRVQNLPALGSTTTDFAIKTGAGRVPDTSPGVVGQQADAAHISSGVRHSIAPPPPGSHDEGTSTDMTSSAQQQISSPGFQLKYSPSSASQDKPEGTGADQPEGEYTPGEFSRRQRAAASKPIPGSGDGHVESRRIPVHATSHVGSADKHSPVSFSNTLALTAATADEHEDVHQDKLVSQSASSTLATDDVKVQIRSTDSSRQAYEVQHRQGHTGVHTALTELHTSGTNNPPVSAHSVELGREQSGLVSMATTLSALTLHAVTLTAPAGSISRTPHSDPGPDTSAVEFQSEQGIAHGSLLPSSVGEPPVSLSTKSGDFRTPHADSTPSSTTMKTVSEKEPASSSPPSASSLLLNMSTQSSRSATGTATVDSPHAAQESSCTYSPAVTWSSTSINSSKSTITTEESAITSSKSAITTEESAITSEKSAITTEESAITTEESAITSEKSAITTEESAITTEESAITSEKSAITTEESAITTEESAITTEESAITSEKSAITSEKSAITTEESAITSSKSAITSEESAITASKSAITSEASASSLTSSKFAGVISGTAASSSSNASGKSVGTSEKCAITSEISATSLSSVSGKSASSRTGSKSAGSSSGKSFSSGSSGKSASVTRRESARNVSSKSASGTRRRSTGSASGKSASGTRGRSAGSSGGSISKSPGGISGKSGRLATGGPKLSTVGGPKLSTITESYLEGHSHSATVKAEKSTIVPTMLASAATVSAATASSATASAATVSAATASPSKCIPVITVQPPTTEEESQTEAERKHGKQPIIKPRWASLPTTNPRFLSPKLRKTKSTSSKRKLTTTVRSPPKGAQLETSPVTTSTPKPAASRSTVRSRSMTAPAAVSTTMVDSRGRVVARKTLLQARLDSVNRQAWAELAEKDKQPTETMPDQSPVTTSRSHHPSTVTGTLSVAEDDVFGFARESTGTPDRVLYGGGATRDALGQEPTDRSLLRRSFRRVSAWGQKRLSSGTGSRVRETDDVDAAAAGVAAHQTGSAPTTPVHSRGGKSPSQLSLNDSTSSFRSVTSPLISESPTTTDMALLKQRFSTGTYSSANAVDLSDVPFQEETLCIQVLSNVYVANINTICQPSMLALRRIRYVVNLSGRELPLLPLFLVTHDLYISDKCITPSLFKCGSDFIQEHRASGYGIVVYSEQGASRAPACIIDYLIRHEGRALLPAYNLIKSLLPHVSMSLRLFQMLLSVERSELGVNSMDAEDYIHENLTLPRLSHYV